MTYVDPKHQSQIVALPRTRAQRPRRLLAIALACLTIGLATAAASPAAPSTLEIKILEPRDASEVLVSPLLLKLEVHLPPDETLVGVRVLIDGRLAAQARGLKLVPAVAALSPGETSPAAGVHLVSVSLPPHDCTLTAVAEGTRSKSPPAMIRLRWRGATSDATQRSVEAPSLYVLSVGVSDYSQSDLRLRFAAKDAQDLASVLDVQQRGLYRHVTSRVLVNRAATKGNILDGLEWLQRQTTARDVAVLFLAGHGIVDPSTGTYYFLPHDADPAAVKRTMLPETDLRSTLANIAGKTLFFIDTCHSGRVFDRTQSRDGNDLTAFIAELAATENGVVVFAASTGRQASQEAAEWNNGAFTRALVEGLRGRADHRKSGRITLNMLDLYISERVKELTSGRQTPTTAKPSTIADFPVALVPEVSDEDVTVFR